MLVIIARVQCVRKTYDLIVYTECLTEIHNFVHNT